MTTKRILPGLLLLVFLSLGYHPVEIPAQAGTFASSGMWISPALGLGGKTIDAALAEPLEDTFEVKVGNPPAAEPKTLRTCQDYLAVKKSIVDAGPNVIATVFYAQVARCDALDLLRSAKPAARSSFREFSFKQLSVKQLPPGLALIIANETQSKADRMARKGGSILDMDHPVTLRPKGDDQAEIIAPDWTANLTIYARADFLGTGDEQLLLRRDAAVKQGTYRSTRLYLLSRPSPSGPLRIERIRP